MRQAAGALLGFALLASVSTGVLAFSFVDVAARAKTLAASPFKSTGREIPKELRDLSLDQYRQIRHRPEKALWRGQPFEASFFHEGWKFDLPVKINEITNEGVREIRFDPADFDYGSSGVDPAALKSLGFAGFRLNYPINSPRVKDEVVSFLGASYFRALGKDQRYGSSARGLAIDTGSASGEEFPRFVEFWIERPPGSSADVAIYALLDSKSAAGAYRFVLRPGVDTVMDVKARIFLRNSVTKLGVAPLTSMFFSGENQRAASDDYRPEVHDSDGLAIHSGAGEWLWRPLVNPKRLLITSFAMTDPRGFGLMQRGRTFGDYEDLEQRFELRPSIWVEPKGKWGAGRIELVQIPAPDETNDNIVAYWMPDKPPAAGEPLDIEYRLLWQKDREIRPALATVQQTRRGRGYVGASAGNGASSENSVAFNIDFDPPPAMRGETGSRGDTASKGDAKTESKSREEPQAQVWADANGRVLEQSLVRNAVNGGWRLKLRLRQLDLAKPVELRALLKSGMRVLSETWSYILPPS